ncbi:MAG: hypothetical protein ACREL9_00220, partial [Gemmatimonadales bacterium]
RWRSSCRGGGGGGGGGDAATQLSLLDEPPVGEAPETERDRVLARVIDQLRDRFGPDAVTRAGSEEAGAPPD